MRAKVHFQFYQTINGERSRSGDIIEATGANLLQCHADATMQFMRKWVAKLHPNDLFRIDAEIIPDGTTDAAEMEKTRADVSAGKIPDRWCLPGMAENEGQ